MSLGNRQIVSTARFRRLRAAGKGLSSFGNLAEAVRMVIKRLGELTPGARRMPMNSDQPNPRALLESSQTTFAEPYTSPSASRLRSSTIGIMGIVVVALALRPSLVSVGPALAQIQTHFSLQHWVASLLTAIPDLLMGLLALPAPWLAHRFGRDRLIVAALVILCLSTVARAFSWNVAFLLLTTVGIGAGIAISGALLSGFVKAAFAKRAASVMGIYATALSLGSTCSALISAPLAAGPGGWRLAIGIWGIVGIGAILAWVIVMQSEVTLDAARAGSGRARPALPWRNRTAWRLAAFFAAVNLIFYALLAWIAPMYLEAGVAQDQVGLLLGVFTGIFTVSSFVVGWLSRDVDRRMWLFGCSIVTAVGLVMLSFTGAGTAFLAVTVVALGLGGAFTLAMTLPLDNTTSPEETNAWTAFSLTIGYIVAAAGPLMMGALRDFSGAFAGAIYVLVVLAIGMAGLSVTLRPREASSAPA